VCGKPVICRFLLMAASIFVARALTSEQPRERLWVWYSDREMENSGARSLLVITMSALSSQIFHRRPARSRVLHETTTVVQARQRDQFRHTGSHFLTSAKIVAMLALRFPAVCFSSSHSSTACRPASRVFPPWNHLRWHRCQYTTEVREWEGSDATSNRHHNHLASSSWNSSPAQARVRYGPGSTGTVEAALLCGVPEEGFKGGALKLPT